MALIFSVEDDKEIGDLLKLALPCFNYKLEIFENAEDMFDKLDGVLPDLILLDIMLPKMDGMQALKKLKSSGKTNKIPVIMLTAKGNESSIVNALDEGADDYMAKPFSVMELNSRIKANLRKYLKKEEKISLLNITLDLNSRKVFIDEEEVHFALKEFEVLKILMTNPNTVISRERLLGEVWGTDFLGETRTLDMHIKAIRSKIGDSAETDDKIVTVRGVGFMFVTK